MSAVSDMVNGWPGGIIQAGRTAVFVSPLYHANAMYASHLGADRLQTRVEGPTFDTSREGKSIPTLDVVASRSADGKSIYIKLVNTDMSRTLATRFEIAGANVTSEAEHEILAAPNQAARNGFLTPDAISVRTAKFTGGRNFTLSLPARSVSVLTLHISP
jgi:alpha-L-arabinofuranosidase